MAAAQELLLLYAVVPATGLLAGGVLFLPPSLRYWSRSHLAVAIRANAVPILAGIGIILLNVLETANDPAITAFFGWDFTAPFAAVDGDLHTWLQARMAHWVRVAFAMVYVLGFPFALYFTPFFFAWLDDRVRVRRAVLAIGLCYGVAIPFYVLFPVNEVWLWSQSRGGNVQNLALVFPWVGDMLYQMSGVNNNFPSLHTALSASLAAVAWDSPSRRFAWFMAALASLTAVSTVLLGIHWTLDVVAGLALAWGVAVAVRRMVPLSGSPAQPDPSDQPRAQASSLGTKE